MQKQLEIRSIKSISHPLINLKMKDLTQKIMTVGSVFRFFPRGRSKVAPLIRIQGKWLADHGFAIGEALEVTVTENTIILKRLKA